jgi:hypothetical protein
MIAIAAAFLLAAPTDLPPKPGETWESSVEISMTGAHVMTMPAQTEVFCKPLENWNEPPGIPTDGNCTMYDLKTSPAGMSWAMECKTPVMKGTGELQFDGPKAYSGRMSMTMAEGTMTMKMAGKRLGERCDANEQARKVNTMQRDAEVQGANVMAQTCTQNAKAGFYQAFVGEHAFCKGPENKAMFCSSIETEEGFSGISFKAGDTTRGIGEASTFCGTGPDALRKKVCDRAVAGDNLKFVARQCPVLAQEIAQRECAGRKYTSMIGTEYAEFCATYAQEMMAGNDPAQDPEQQPAAKDGAKEKGKKLLKGLFGK